MYQINKSSFHRHIYESTDGYIAPKQYSAFHSILSKGINSENPSYFVVHGERYAGKHAFVFNALKFEERPIFSVNASELVAEDQIDPKSLTKAMRICISVVFKENLKIIIGEVVNLTGDKIHLKTKDIESVFEIGSRMKNEIQKERVTVGDIIEIYKESGFINRIGKSKNSQEQAFDYPSLLPSAIPEGEIIRTELMTSVISLDELDVVNSRIDGHECLYMNVDVSDRIRNEIDTKISKWIYESKASFVRGVLIVEDSQFLSEKAFSDILRMGKMPYSPSIIFVYNGVPDFRNYGEFRFNIVMEQPRMIIKSVAKSMGMDLEEESINLLETATQERGISWAIQLMSSAGTSGSVPADGLKKVLSIFDRGFESFVQE